VLQEMWLGSDPRKTVMLRSGACAYGSWTSAVGFKDEGVCVIRCVDFGERRPYFRWNRIVLNTSTEHSHTHIVIDKHSPYRLPADVIERQTLAITDLVAACLSYTGRSDGPCVAAEQT
jgi:hypothetical protein